MGKLKEIKSKEDRVKEGISLLNQLREAGVREDSAGFRELKGQISNWVKSQDGWEGSISFLENGRVAEVDLPKYHNRAAGINFKVKRVF